MVKSICVCWHFDFVPFHLCDLGQIVQLLYAPVFLFVKWNGTCLLRWWSQSVHVKHLEECLAQSMPSGTVVITGSSVVAFSLLLWKTCSHIVLELEGRSCYRGGNWNPKAVALVFKGAVVVLGVLTLSAWTRLVITADLESPALVLAQQQFSCLKFHADRKVLKVHSVDGVTFPFFSLLMLKNCRDASPRLTHWGRLHLFPLCWMFPEFSH